jgi:hypothetical protein
MQLELIRSKPELDVCEEALCYKPTKGMERSQIDGDEWVYVEVSFAGEVGRNLPFVRVALDLEDAIKIIEALADKGDPKAALTKNACALAFAIADFAKEATGQAT